MTDFIKAYEGFKKDYLQRPVKRRRLVSDNILRINQFDSSILNDEILKHLMYYFHFRGNEHVELISKVQDEMKLMLKGCLFYFSVWKLRRSYGDQVQNLRYKKGTPGWKFALYFVISVLFPYLFTKFQKYITFQEWGRLDQEEWKRKLWKVIRYFEIIFQWSNLLNFLVFLKFGHYRTLEERICGLRLEYFATHMQRTISFDYMNRDLIWSGFAELLLFFVPLINIDSWVANIQRTISYVTGQHRRTNTKQTQQTNDKRCPICADDPIQLPVFALPCKHSHCYLCLNMELQKQQSTGKEVNCLICQQKITAYSRNPPE